MVIRNLANLNDTLLKDEFDLAKTIYNLARDAGLTPHEAAAVAYRHGYLDGRALEEVQTRKAYAKLAEFQSLNNEWRRATGVSITKTLKEILHSPEYRCVREAMFNSSGRPESQSMALNKEVSNEES